jgi:HNH endonuclease
MITLTADRFRYLLDYDPATGVWTWLVSTSNCTRAGAAAGHTGSDGYHRIKIDGRSYLAHRLAWLYQTGAWPKREIDHRTLNKGDNRFENLREATDAQNVHNRTANKGAHQARTPCAPPASRSGCLWRRSSVSPAPHTHFRHRNTRDLAYVLMSVGQAVTRRAGQYHHVDAAVSAPAIFRSSPDHAHRDGTGTSVHFSRAGHFPFCGRARAVSAQRIVASTARCGNTAPGGQSRNRRLHEHFARSRANRCARFT